MMELKGNEKGEMKGANSLLFTGVAIETFQKYDQFICSSYGVPLINSSKFCRSFLKVHNFLLIG